MNAYEGLAEYIYTEERKIRAAFQAHTKHHARTFHRIAGIPSFPTGSGIRGNFLLSRTYSIRDRICRPSGHLAKAGIGIRATDQAAIGLRIGGPRRASAEQLADMILALLLCGP